jgi:hypothetical protein
MERRMRSVLFVLAAAICVLPSSALDDLGCCAGIHCMGDGGGDYECHAGGIHAQCTVDLEQCYAGCTWQDGDGYHVEMIQCSEGCRGCENCCTY